MSNADDMILQMQKSLEARIMDVRDMQKSLEARIMDIRDEVRAVHAEERGQRLALEQRLRELESERDSNRPLVKIVWAGIVAGITAVAAAVAAKFGGK